MALTRSQIADYGRCPDGIYVAPDEGNDLSTLLLTRMELCYLRTTWAVHWRCLSVQRVLQRVRETDAARRVISTSINASPNRRTSSADRRHLARCRSVRSTRTRMMRSSCQNSCTTCTRYLTKRHWRRSHRRTHLTAKFAGTHMLTSLFHTDRALFDQLAARSATLSTSDSSLYDIDGGSGVPGEANTANRVSDTPQALQFVPLSDACLASVRADMLSM